MEGISVKRYVLIEEEAGCIDIRYIEERPDLKHPLLLGQIQVQSGKCVYIFVKPSRRRRGYGSMLLRISAKYCGGTEPRPDDILQTPAAVGFWKNRMGDHEQS